MGDPAGVGIDVALAAAALPELAGAVDVCLVGSHSAIDRRARLLSAGVDVEVLDVGDAAPDPGRPTEAGARAAVRSIETAAGMCLAGEADAMVTGPVSKAAICDAGIAFSGHTEFLADLTGAPTPVMTFVSGTRRVALATTHHALSEVAGIISSELIVSTLLVLSEGLRDWLGVAEPRIAVAALNPHAGENGRLGDEEARVITPAIETAAGTGVLVEGPFPADSIFRGLGPVGPVGRGWRFDAVLAMYHDQATIPAKMWGGATVNLTLGLPIVRASVDHGTAFEIAGSGTADCGSMAAALRLAAAISLRRADV
jgi:4-hydroxythreonine-4-phosphate dehydrogenase